MPYNETHTPAKGFIMKTIDRVNKKVHTVTDNPNVRSSAKIAALLIATVVWVRVVDAAFDKFLD